MRKNTTNSQSENTVLDVFGLCSSAEHAWNNYVRSKDLESKEETSHNNIFIQSLSQANDIPGINISQEINNEKDISQDHFLRISNIISQNFLQ